MSWMAISENNSSSAELNAKSLETQIISQKYEQNTYSQNYQKVKAKEP